MNFENTSFDDMMFNERYTSFKSYHYTLVCNTETTYQGRFLWLTFPCFTDQYCSYSLERIVHVNKYIGESRQPQAIFQFPFFFWQVDNKESKNKYSSITV